MKIAVILGAFSIGTRPLDFHFDNIWKSIRGLTGTDLSTVMISEELRKAGHDVHLFTVHAQPHNKPAIWKDVKLYNFEERFQYVDDTFDAIISINEPDVFRGMTNKPLRICWQFLNDFTYCQPDFNQYVDCWVSVCNKHMEHLKSVLPDSKWNVIPLGCDPSLYEDKRVAGRVVWTSSADRGLHWLLSQWPTIRKEVPHASLRIFYHFNYKGILEIEPDAHMLPQIVEMGQRLRYIKEAIVRLKDFGVEHVQSVSRESMTKEFNEAAVFAFSADTVAFTEGFSVSTMESHASFTVPIITDVDCLGSVYNDSGAIIIKSPIKDHLPQFTNSIIKALTNEEFSNSVIEKCRKFSQNYTWAGIAKQMEQLILNNHKGRI